MNGVQGSPRAVHTDEDQSNILHKIEQEQKSSLISPAAVAEIIEGQRNENIPKQVDEKFVC